MTEAAAISVEQITTWEEAIKAFPCPNCSIGLDARFPKLSPGFKQAGHSRRGGNICRPCFVCQPDATRHRFGSAHRDVPEVVARKLIEQRYPVRYVWEWKPSGEEKIPVVLDRADGSEVWRGEPGDNGFDAKREIEKLNRKWWGLVRLVEHAPPPDGQMYVIGTAPCANCDDQLVRVFSHDGRGGYAMIWWHLAPEDSIERLVRGDGDHAVPNGDEDSYEDVIPPVLYSKYYEAHAPQPAR